MNAPKRVRALIVEDDYWAGEMIKSLLQEAGYNVIGRAMSGEQAIERLEQLSGAPEQPDVVLMDIEMPGMNGIEATRRIQALCPTPVVVLTAYETDELIAQASAAGAGAYLVKPPEVGEVKRAIAVAMARFDDMLALRQANRRLEETLAELRAAQQQMIQQERLAAVGQLAAGIAHEYNNVMASVILYADILLNSFELPAQVRERVTIIRQQGLRAAFLTQQILDFGRKAMLRLQDVDLVALLEEIAQSLKSALPDNIHLHHDFGVNPVVVHADPDRVRQAILNLVDNACEAMLGGGDLFLGVGRQRVEPDQPAPLPHMEPGDWARISVTDSGTGIAPDALSRIFEPFYTTRAPLGSGLGLAQVHGIIKQHQGHIDVQTEVGRGSTFVLFLPALALRESQPFAADVELLPAGRGETILVMEQDPLLRSVLADCLETLNYHVLTVANAQEALEILTPSTDGLQTASPVDVALVLCDLTLEQAGDISLCQALKRRRPQVSLVVLTDWSLVDVVGSAEMEGIVGWLKKPVSLEQLAEVVARALKHE